MGALTTEEKALIRRFIENKANESGVPISWTKAAVNAAAQAVEDFLTSNAGAISNAIDNATIPYSLILSAAQKKFLVAMVLYVKYWRDK